MCLSSLYTCCSRAALRQSGHLGLRSYHIAHSSRLQDDFKHLRDYFKRLQAAFNRQLGRIQAPAQALTRPPIKPLHPFLTK